MSVKVQRYFSKVRDRELDLQMLDHDDWEDRFAEILCSQSAMTRSPIERAVQ